MEKSKEEGNSSENNESQMWEDAECVTPLDMPDGLNQATIKLRHMSKRPRFEAVKTFGMEVHFQHILDINTSSEFQAPDNLPP